MITTYTLDEAEKWDNIVKSFCDYDVYYLSGYVKAFEINGDGQGLLIYFEGGNTRAINVVMKRDVSCCQCFSGKLGKNEYYDFATPYGYGGFIVEGQDYELLEREYKEFCETEHVICEFVRFHPILECWKQVSRIYTDIHLGETVYMDTTSEKIIWENMTSKNRNMIRKAQKNGLKVYWGRDPEIIKIFVDIYNTTMDEDEAEEYYYFKKEFYESILEDLKQNAMWFYVKKDNEIIAISIFLFANKYMNYHLSASKKEYRCLAPTNLLLYEAAIWASNHGYSTLHMGGGVGSGNDSLYKFKKSFNRGNDTEFHIGKRIFLQEEYDALVMMRQKNDDKFDKNSQYFPAYRIK